MLLQICCLEILKPHCVIKLTLLLIGQLSGIVQ